MERFRDDSFVKGNIKIFMNGKLTMNKRYSRAIGMLQNTGAGSGHMLGQLRPGQHHVTMVPAWHCSALPILQHWAPDFLTALQPPALLSPGSTQQTITTSSPSPGQRSRVRPRLPARALAAKSEPAAAAASLLGPRQVPGVAGVSRRPCWGGAGPGEGRGQGAAGGVAGAGGWRWCCPGAAWPRTERGSGPGRGPPVSAPRPPTSPASPGHQPGPGSVTTRVKCEIPPRVSSAVC